MRGISLRGVNFLLFGALAALVVAYWGELRWAQRELFRMLGGDVGRPAEREMYREAQWIIENRGDMERARELLERALEIDPTCEAGYWLGEYYHAVGRDADALERFSRYVDIDPTKPGAWLIGAEILEQSGRDAEALAWLKRGHRFFAGHRDKLRPRESAEVESKYNRKAARVYRDHVEALFRLEEEIARLERPAE